MTAPTVDLESRMLRIVSATPGINTLAICRDLRVRKSDVLVELERLRREHLLHYEPGHKGSKCWFVVAETSSCSPRCSRRTPGPTSDSEPAERDELA